MTCPLLVQTSIESIYELHAFFNALLARSNQQLSAQHSSSCESNRHTPLPVRRSYLPGGSRAPRQSLGCSSTGVLMSRDAANSHFHQQRQVRSAGNAKSKTTSDKKQKKLEKRNRHLSGSHKHHHHQQQQQAIDYSLEELFLNIDQIIANDFLEPSEQ